MSELQKQIEAATGEKFRSLPAQSGRVVAESGAAYFLKCGSVSAAYRCEANGLAALAASGEIRVAEVVAVGDSYLLTRYVETSPATPEFFARFGRELARLHRHTASQFGFYEDNFIGATPQLNIPDATEQHEWSAFYFNKRLLFQFRLAEKNGYADAEFKLLTVAIQKNIRRILNHAPEPPSLMHGDLWRGNFLCDTDGRAVLIDPAVYYGHREADLAMTRLFGGFPLTFYEAYHSEYPMRPASEYRDGIYRLYHILNHLNIFGTSYLYEAKELMRLYKYV
ncbi:MAG: fructosamine kinase family protein [Bacteroidales bacterium]|jgi:fructosamine-3-kinase|nr:fructosamine kinase family protein [Bacteroidales bacterium]